MKVKKLFMTLLITLLVIAMTGCEDNKQNDEILSEHRDDDSEMEDNGELSANWYMESEKIVEYFNKRNVSVQEITINKTFTEGREHEASVNIIASNTHARLDADYTITSKQYDSGEWEVIRISAVGNEIYLPIFYPEINISFDDSEVIVTSTEMENQGDDLRFIVYYNRIFDGNVARIEESHYKNYFWDKSNSEDWVTNNLKDECLSGACEIKDISGIYETRTEDQKNKANIEILVENNLINIKSFSARVSSYFVYDLQLIDGYNYNNIDATVELYKSNNKRIASSPCDMDYTYGFKVYNDGKNSNTSAVLFVTPDQLWLVIYYDGKRIMCLI